jgi:LEA14-like dessication related protein
MKALLLSVLPVVLLLSCATPAKVQPTQPSVPTAIPPAPRPFSAPPVVTPDTPAPKSVPEAAPAPPLPRPNTQLSFERIEAESVDHLILYYQLRIDNLLAVPLYVDLTEPRILVNGTHSVIVSSLMLQNGNSIVAQPSTSTTIPLQLNLDLSTFPPNFDEYTFQLTLTAVYRAENSEPLSDTLSCDISFPRIRVPELLVTSIEVSQSDLINTRLKVSIRIDNPNLFPVQLSSLTYQLYGDERFWAEGKATLSLNIPAKSSASTDVALIMNFINMPRATLDKVIAMKQLNYRFTGETTVAVPVTYLPSFRLLFDLSGKSAVVQ